MLNPNPATNQVNISYVLMENMHSATIKIANTNGIVVKTELLNNQQGTITINTQDFAVGQYSVQLLSSSNELLDSKVLIIQ